MSHFSSDQIFNSVSDGVVAIDKNFIIKTFNNAASEMTGWEPSEAIGRYCYEIFNSSLCRQACSLKQTIETEMPLQYPQVLIRSKDDKTIPIRCSTYPIRNEKNEIIGVLEMLSDLRGMYSTYLGRFRELGMIGSSKAIQEVFQLIEAVAATNSNVLINGETGTGKELVADAIYKLSPRKDKPFIKVNCAALSDSLLESELFGHEKGAFTGALNKRIGRFEEADSGTIFLDEIAEISPSFQAKLLRVLQEGEFERVGSSKTIKVDVRVIVATNKDLYNLVEQRQFRGDLYYRLNVFPIQLPPLRRRIEDLESIANYYINNFNLEFENQKSGLSQEALDFLYDYHFPGNIRELKNIIEHAFIRATGPMIEIKDFPAYFHDNEDKMRGILKESNINQGNDSKNKDEEEAELLLRTIKECGGNKSLAAKKLGISRKTIYNRIKALGIDA